MNDDQAQKPSKNEPHYALLKPDAPPREWWITDDGQPTFDFIVSSIPRFANSVHVIEKSAYDAKCDELILVGKDWAYTKLERDALSARVAELEERNTALYLGIRAERDAAKEREANLVAFVQSLSDGIMADGDYVDTSISMNAHLLLEELKANKGGA